MAPPLLVMAVFFASSVKLIPTPSPLNSPKASVGENVVVPSGTGSSFWFCVYGPGPALSPGKENSFVQPSDAVQGVFTAADFGYQPVPPKVPVVTSLPL